MSTAGSSTGQKRKAQNAPPLSSSNVRKRRKFQDARTISTETADAALSTAGELNIASFIKTREFEITALDKSMKKARQALSSRAFQQVPRQLRRRTASHNAKKVPRRLRGRAVREMIEDNTPKVDAKTRKPTSRLRLRLETAKALRKLNQKRKSIRQKKREAKADATETDPSKHVDIVRIPRIKKNKLAEPPLATSKFKRRQISKSWLPTHLWHTKRAHMTKATEPLWRMAIPLRPTEKSYRATHRASASKGCIAWDMSYMSTVICRGTDTTLEKLLKLLAFQGHGWSGQRYTKWKSGSRFADGWVHGIDNKEPLAPAIVIWCPQLAHAGNSTAEKTATDAMAISTGDGHATKHPKRKLDRKVMIRVHPSSFHQFWMELLKAAKLQKPQVLVEDLRFEIGSIDIMGPDSIEALTSALTPSNVDEQLQKLWTTILPLSNPALLPTNVILSMEVRDPRLALKSRPTIAARNCDPTALYDMVTAWPLDAKPKPPALFSNRARYCASALPSQWTLNRRRQAILPGQALQPRQSDPSIPIMLLAHRPGSSSSAQQGSWTLLAPWKCIDVIWRKILHQPLSSGDKLRFGGLYQKQQIAFEQSIPCFPGDYPGTDAGKAWERSQAEKRFDEWIRHPPSRRIAWNSLDLGLDRKGELGRGWSCDWEYLLNDTGDATGWFDSATKKPFKKTSEASLQSQTLLTQRQRKAAQAELETRGVDDTTRRNTSSPEADDAVTSELIQEPQFTQIPAAVAKALTCNVNVTAMPSRPVLVSIRITFLTSGHPKDAARIYRLPEPPLQQNANANTNHQMLSQRMLPEKPLKSARQSTGIPSSHVSKSTVKENMHDLRNRWLLLDTDKTSCESTKPMKKDKPNHRGFSRRAQNLPSESLRHINVLPKNATPEIREQYGPKPPSEEDRKICIARDMAVRMEERKTWEKHVPSPHSKDLIGFVTKGGYNLTEGKGTAIGAIWLQRVIHGWAAEDHMQAAQDEAKFAQNTKLITKSQQQESRHKHRVRHLCIVRNAGESIGRLAKWELCE